jgi:DNA polymerase III epsilon subunit-like protein
MIVVDVETTGLDERKNSIVSIGAVDFSSPRNQFYSECRIWDGAEIDQRALEINGFSVKDITDLSKPSLEDAMRKFVSWAENIKDVTLAGENVGKFDSRFLEASANMYGIKWIFGHRTFDLHSEAYGNYQRRGLMPPMKDNRSDINSDSILAYTGLPAEPHPHNGLTGAKMEAEAFSRLIRGRKFFQEYSKFEIPDYLRK